MEGNLTVKKDRGVDSIEAQSRGNKDFWKAIRNETRKA